MNLKKLVIVLAHPEESRNVGAVCRAMANNGIGTLRIVGKKEDFDEERVRILAIHAADIWERTEFFDSVQDATADCAFAAGTTRRRGKKRKGKLYLPEEFAEFAAKTTGTKSGEGQKIAVVFGNERTGLTDEELAACTMGVTIPSCPAFASLNLSHAVQIICYHLFRIQDKTSPGYTPLTLERIDKTVTTITDNLQKIGFFSLAGRTDMERFWRMILSRASLSEGEAVYLEKIFDKAAGLSQRNNNANDTTEKTKFPSAD
ncbi:MAG: RNA methyltransferase [Treponema sp.]|nr:RNA methyltransferase [Treponema sp.]